MTEDQPKVKYPPLDIERIVDKMGPIEPKPFNVKEEVQKVIDEFNAAREVRSFSGRNPELGKMITCVVCGLRHRGAQCTPHYKELYIEEDVKTGEKTVVYAMADQHTSRGVNGAATFAKRRFHPHLNHRKQVFIERVRQLFGEGTFDPESEEYKEALKRARVLANRQLRAEYAERANKRRRMQDVSRRINLGLALAGSQ